MKRALLSLFFTLVCGIAFAVPIVLQDSSGNYLGTASNPLKASFSGDQTISGTLGVSGDLTVSGTLELTGLADNSVPYNNATGGLVDSGIYVSGGNVGIGDTTPSYKLDVNGVINATTGLKINGVDVGTSSDSYWSAATGGINYSAGNVGVGDSTPGYLLDVAGNLGVDGSIYIGGLYQFGPYSAFYGAVTPIEFYNTRTSGTYQDMLSVRHRSNDATSVLRRVGIAFSLSSNTDLSASQKMGAITAESESGWANSPSLNFWTNNSKRVTLAYDGKFGIGTTTPATILSVSSGSPTISLTDTDTGADSYVDANSSSGSLALRADVNNEVAGSTLTLGIDGSTKVTVDSSGYVGIGDTTPAALLDVGGGTLTYIDGVNDLLVKDDVEVDGDIYVAGFGSLINWMNSHN